MDDQQLLRYSRQIMLPEIDVAGQERLLAARVLILGLGGLGSPASLYLAAAGVGELTLVDDDQVDASNLQRQILHGEADIDRRKTDSAHDRLRALNARTKLHTVNARLDADALHQQVAKVDLVVDGTDNLSTRYALNQTCLEHGVPWVSAAAIRFAAQLSSFDPRRDDSPCYRCLWPDAEDSELNCAENGVVAPLVGLVGATQALEAVKMICGIGTSLVGRVLVLDGLSLSWQEFSLHRQANCPACGEPGPSTARPRTDLS